jgi:hypothetical protein
VNPLRYFYVTYRVELRPQLQEDRDAWRYGAPEQRCDLGRFAAGIASAGLRRLPGPAGRAPPVNCGRSALPVVVSVPYAGAVPDGGRHGYGGEAAGPPSSSGLGHRPFKAAARVQIPLGAPAGIGWQTQGPVEQLGVLATLSRWRSRVQIPSGPLGKSGGTVSPRWSGSSVGTSVRLKSGRSAVRPRP